MAKRFDEFKKLYQVSKTLRFEARPVGATLCNIQENGLIEDDENRAVSYGKVKKLIDEYHKAFIDRVLDNFCLPMEDNGEKDSLQEYYKCYSSDAKDEATAREFSEIKKNLRLKIVKALTKDEVYKDLFSSKLIQSHKDKESKEIVESRLIQFINSVDGSHLAGLSKEEALDAVREFFQFTTYFTGFFENRKNMYSPDEKSTGIGYRLIDENLPKFIDNMEAFKKISAIQEMQDNISQLYSDMEEYLNVTNIGEMFELGYYSTLLTQRQIDVYNAIIGGRTDENVEVKTKGINEYVNLYNQSHKDAKLPKLKVLYKQILSDRNAISWLPEEFENDQKVLCAIKSFYEGLEKDVLGDSALKSLLCSLADYNLDGIYIRNDSQLANISKKMYDSWSVIQDAIFDDIRRTDFAGKRKQSEEVVQKKLSSKFSKADSFSIKYLNDCLGHIESERKLTVEDYFSALGAMDGSAKQGESLFAGIANAYEKVKDLLHSDYPKEKNLAQDKASVEKIKDLLDAIVSLHHFVKPLLGHGDEANKDMRFYGELNGLWDRLSAVTPLYNMTRNWMTRKPYSDKKVKLNFGNSQLLDGWDANKEKDYLTILLRRDGKYYLAVLTKDSNQTFVKSVPSDGECYEKMVYKLLPGPNKMLPKVFFSKSRIDEFNPSKELVCKYQNGTHTKGKNFNLKDCHDLIDFFKQSINKHEDWSKFGFCFSDTSKYEDLSGFYREVERQGYNLSFTKVSVSFIDKMVKEGKMFLFELYNKDFSKYSKGTPNMHTLYWKALFDERNLADVVYKLNGKAELFFRKKSIVDKTNPTHPANNPIKNKNKDNNKKESLFEYDLIKDRRYTVDKFQFHVPITMNFKSTGTGDINLLSREYLHDSEDVHIIGIDRGERHLLYVAVIDMKGNIKEQFSLNDIINEHNGNTYRTNYHDLLDAREEDRLKARRSWQTIENIKELKEGYLSQVIHKISQLMVKYHAVVVLEDLNRGFIRGRQKVEKQVYQKFEKMLIDKLNYLVDKKADAEQPGGLLNAYQLTSKFDSFQKLGKQCGFLFYVPAWNTSKIDPVTGFVNLLDTRYKNVGEAQKFFSSFDAIRYNASKDWFEFDLNYEKFGKKAENSKKDWRLCTRGKRILTYRDEDKNSQWNNKEVDLTAEFKTLFASYNIDVNGNIKESVVAQKDKTFYERLLQLLKFTLQMRNSVTGAETDYLVSPVADERGNFYDSSLCGSDLPQNADANGAYNIARKGLMLIRQIKAADDLSKIKYDLSNSSWLNFAQQKPYRDSDE